MYLNATSTAPAKPFDGKDILFGIAACICVVVAHAIAYLTHEYAHSFTAWALGWMANPLAIDYGPPTLYNIIFLGGVSDNVNYAPILAGGHGLAVVAIALAGMLIGNAALYYMLFLAARTRLVMTRPALLAGIFTLALMCAGNVWGYVPIRGFTTHADIAIAASGLHLQTWVMGLCLLPLSLHIVWHCLFRFLPQCLDSAAAKSDVRLVLIITLTGYWLFVFYGGEGTSGDYGLVSQLLSITSKYFLFPLSVAALVTRHHSARSMNRWLNSQSKADLTATSNR
ncbi:hypothetical protein DYST_00979 [Dyella terrae]|nr:hypothetical protein DYST_00979 [Dyella terrae]